MNYRDLPPVRRNIELRMGFQGENLMKHHVAVANKKRLLCERAICAICAFNVLFLAGYLYNAAQERAAHNVEFARSEKLSWTGVGSD